MGWKSLLVTVVPAKIIAPVIARRTWTTRHANDVDDHLSMYWETVDSEHRRPLIDLLTKEIAGHPGSPSVLEFGSHVGVNFHALELALAGRTMSLYAVEPNHEAVRFMRDRLPHVNVLRADHRGFLAARAFPDRALTVSFANAVFYSMSARSTRRVLRKMMSRSSAVIIGDNIANSEGASSIFRSDNGSFAHPFATWLREGGFGDVVEHPANGSGDYALSGYLVARRTGKA